MKRQERLVSCRLEVEEQPLERVARLGEGLVLGHYFRSAAVYQTCCWQEVVAVPRVADSLAAREDQEAPVGLVGTAEAVAGSLGREVGRSSPVGDHPVGDHSPCHSPEPRQEFLESHEPRLGPGIEVDWERSLAVGAPDSQREEVAEGKGVVVRQTEAEVVAVVIENPVARTAERGQLRTMTRRFE